MKDLVELEIRELLESYGFDSNLPVVGGSARLALEESSPSELGTLSVQSLMNFVDNYIKQPERSINAPFLLSVEGTLVVKGRGTVVTGKVDQGKVTINDELDIVGSDTKSTICLGLEMFRKSLDYAEVGDNVGILIRGVKKDEVSRGDVIVTPGTIKAYNNFDAKAYILTKKEGGRHKGFVSNYTPQFFFRTLNVTGIIKILDTSIKMVLPGDSVSMNVSLVHKAPLVEGLKFIMREGNLTIGAGVVTKLY
jgi:elongation factor Tu